MSPVDPMGIDYAKVLREAGPATADVIRKIARRLEMTRSDGKISYVVDETQGGTGTGHVNARYTKGDLLVATGPTTLVKVGVGADDAVLMADSGETEGVAWSANVPLIDAAATITGERVFRGPGDFSRAAISVDDGGGRIGFAVLGPAVINDDAVDTIAEALIPDQGVMLVAGGIESTFGIFNYALGTSLTTLHVGADLENQGTTDLTGTTGTDAKVSVSVNGTEIHIENRIGGASGFTVMTLSGRSG